MSREKFKKIPLKLGCPLYPYLTIIVLESLAIAVRQLEEIKGMQIENEVQVSLFAVDMILYMKDLKNITRKLLTVD